MFAEEGEIIRSPPIKNKVIFCYLPFIILRPGVNDLGFFVYYLKKSIRLCLLSTERDVLCVSM